MTHVPDASDDQRGTLPELVCPHCGGTLDRRSQSTVCLDCNHVPRHGAD